MLALPVLDPHCAPPTHAPPSPTRRPHPRAAHPHAPPTLLLQACDGIDDAGLAEMANTDVEYACPNCRGERTPKLLLQARRSPRPALAVCPCGLPLRSQWKPPAAPRSPTTPYWPTLIPAAALTRTLTHTNTLTLTLTLTSPFTITFTATLPPHPRRCSRRCRGRTARASSPSLYL